MAYTTPRTWVAGEVVTAALLNTHLRDDVSFLANPPACRVFNSAVIATVTGVEKQLTFDSEDHDTDNMHSAVTNTNRITFNTSGIYKVDFTAEFPTNGNGFRYFSVRDQGSATIAFTAVASASITTGVGFCLGTTKKFSVADWIEVYGFQNSTGPLNITASAKYSPYFMATWIGLG